MTPRYWDREIERVDNGGTTLTAAVFRVLQSMSPRERLVISMRFGLGEEQPHTLRQVGRVLGVTPERVRQLERRTLRKLRAAWRCKELRAFL